MGDEDPGREYKPGDKVRRTRDGHPMTVEEVYTPFYVYRVRCSWGPNSRSQSDVYRLDQIEPEDTLPVRE